MAKQFDYVVSIGADASSIAATLATELKNAAIKVEGEKLVFSNISFDDKDLVQKFLTKIKDQFEKHNIQLPFDFSKAIDALGELDVLKKELDSFNTKEIKPTVNLDAVKKATKYTRDELKEIAQEAKNQYDLLKPQARTDSKYGKIFGPGFTEKYANWKTIYSELQTKLQQLNKIQGNKAFSDLKDEELREVYQLLLNIQKLEKEMPKNILENGKTMFDLSEVQKSLGHLDQVKKKLDEIHRKLASQYKTKEDSLFGVLSPIIDESRANSSEQISDSEKAVRTFSSSIDNLNQKIETEQAKLARANEELAKYSKLLEGLDSPAIVTRINDLAEVSRGMMGDPSKTAEKSQVDKEIGFLFNKLKQDDEFEKTYKSQLSTRALSVGIREYNGVSQEYNKLSNKARELKKSVADLATSLENEKQNLATAKANLEAEQTNKPTGSAGGGAGTGTGVAVSPKVDPSQFAADIEAQLTSKSVPVSIVPKVENPEQFVTDIETQLKGHSVKIEIDTKGITDTITSAEGNTASIFEGEKVQLGELQAKIEEVIRALKRKNETIDEEKLHMKEAVDGEIFNLERLKKAVAEVANEIDNKTDRIKAEESQMESSVSNEIAALIRLKTEINNIYQNSDQSSAIPVGVKPDFSAEAFIAEINRQLDGKLANVGVILQAPDTSGDNYKWLASLKEDVAIVEQKLQSVTKIFKELQQLDMSKYTKGDKILQVDLGDPNSLKEVATFLTRIGNIFGKNENLSSDLDILVKRLRSLSKIELSTLNTKDIQLTKFTKAAEKADELVRFAAALERVADALKVLDQYKEVGNVFDAFKMNKNTPAKFTAFATSLAALRTELAQFDDNAKNTLKHIKELAQYGDALKDIRAIVNKTTTARYQKEQEEINPTPQQKVKKEVEKTTAEYDKLENSAKRFFDLSKKAAEGNLNYKEGLELEKLREDYQKAASSVNDFYKIVEDANKIIAQEGGEIIDVDKIVDDVTEAKNHLFNEFQNIQSEFLKYTTSGYANKVNGLINESEGKYLDQYRVRMQSLLKDIEDFAAKDLNLLDTNDLEEFKKFEAHVAQMIKDLNGNKSLMVADPGKIAGLSQNIAIWSEKNKTAAKKFKKELEDIQARLTNINSKAELDELEQAFRNIKNQAQAAGITGISFIDKLKKKFVDLAAYLSTFASFHEIIQLFRQGFTIIKELDDGLTEMRKVSDSSLKTLKEYQRTTFDLADSVGTTSSALQKSTADWMRLGEAMDEAKESALVTTKLLNVSEFGEIGEATEAMIAMSQAYKEMEKGEILDVLNNIGNNFAIGTDDLAQGLQKSASALKATGNDLYAATALMVGANQVTQDALQSGNALRTISLRIIGTEESKQELAALGEDVEDFVVQTQSKIDETVRKYTAVASNQFKGVSLLDDNGNYRSTYEILQDIADIYQEILQADKEAGTNRGSALIELLAGKNRANVLSSILESPQILREVYQTAQNSAGSADEELAKYLDSITGKVEKFKNQLQELASVTFDTEFIKDAIDLGTDLLSLLTDIIDKAGVLGLGATAGAGFGIFQFVKNLDQLGEIGKFSSIFSEFDNLSQASASTLSFLKNSFKDLTAEQILAKVSMYELTDAQKFFLITNHATNKEVVETIDDLYDLEKSLDITSKTSHQLSEGFNGLTVKLKNLSKQLKTLALAHPRITALAIALGALVAIGRINDAFTDSVDEAAERVENAKGKIADLNNEIETLKKKGSLTIVEQDRLDYLEAELSLQQQLLALEEKRYAKAQLGGTSFLGTWVAGKSDFSESGSYLDLYEKDHGVLESLFSPNAIGNVVAGYKEIEARLKGINEQIEIAKANNDDNALAIWGAQYNAAIDKAEGYYGTALTKASEYKAAITNLKADIEFGRYVKGTQEYEDAVKYLEIFKNSYAEALKIITDYEIRTGSGHTAFDAVIEQSGVAKEELIAMAQDGSIKQLDRDMTELSGTFYNIAKALEEAGIPIANFIKYLENLVEVAEGGAAGGYKPTDIFALESMDGSISDLGELSKAIDNIQEAYTTLSSAVKEYDQTGKISIDTLQDIVALGDNWLDYVDAETGALKLDEQALYDLAQARLLEMKWKIQSSIIDNVTKIEDEAGALKYLASTNYDAAKSYEAVAKSKLNAWRTEALQDNKKYGGVGRVNQIYQKAIKDWDKIDALFKNTNIFSLGTGSSGGSQFKETYDFFEDRIDNLNDAYELLESNIENVNGAVAKNNLINAQYDIAAEKLNNYNDALDMYKQKANEALSSIPADMVDDVVNGAVKITDFIGDGNKEVVEAIKDYNSWADKVSEVTAEIAALQEEMRQLELTKFNNIAEQFDSVFDIRGGAIDNIQKQIDLLETAGQVIGEAFYTEAIAQTEKQIDILNEKRVALANQLADSLASGRIQVGTDEWLEMVNTITEVEGSILDAKKSVEEFNNSIQELHWDNLERVGDAFDGITDELSNISDLYDDMDVASKDGTWSDEGLTQLGMAAQQYELARYEAEMYGQEIEQLKKDYAEGKYSATEYAEKLAELNGLQWDSVQAAEDAKDAMVDLNQARIDIIVEGIEEEIKAYEELTQAKIDELEAERDLKNYRDQLADQTKTVAQLEKQLAAMANDNTAATQAKRKQLEEQLAEAKKNLADTEYEHSIDEQTEALNKQLEEFTETKEGEIDELEAYMKDTEKVIIDSFETVKKNASTIATQLETITKKHGVVISNTIMTSWKSGEIAVASYGQTLTAQSSLFTANLITVKNGVYQLQTQANTAAQSVANMFGVSADKLVSELTTSYNSTVNLNNMMKALRESAINALERGYDVSSLVNAANSVSNAFNTAIDSMNRFDNSLPATATGGASSLHRDLGAITNNIIKSSIKYASGTRSAKSGWAEVDEEGEELKFIKINGRSYQMMGAGDQVIPHSGTETLWKWSNIDPAEFARKISEYRVNDMSMLRSLNMVAPDPNWLKNGGVSMVVNNPITIEGNADLDTVRQIQEAVKTETYNAFKKISDKIRK